MPFKDQQKRKEYNRKYHKQYYLLHKKSTQQYYQLNKDRIKKQQKEYYALNRDTICKKNKVYNILHNDKRQEYKNKWNLQNPDKVREYKRRYSKNNPEKIKAKNKRYRQLNKTKIRVYDIKHKILKAGLGGSFTEQEWGNKKKEYNYCCVFCGMSEQKLLETIGIGLTIDHKIPITKWKQWEKENYPNYQCNDIENLQPLCLHCNLSKGNKIL